MNKQLEFLWLCFGLTIMVQQQINFQWTFSRPYAKEILFLSDAVLHLSDMSDVRPLFRTLAML